MAAAASDSTAIQLPNWVATREGYLKLSGEYLLNLREKFAMSYIMINHIQATHHVLLSLMPSKAVSH